jgi:hypothetical protein
MPVSSEGMYHDLPLPPCLQKYWNYFKVNKPSASIDFFSVSTSSLLLQAPQFFPAKLNYHL